MPQNTTKEHLFTRKYAVHFITAKGQNEKLNRKNNTADSDSISRVGVKTEFKQFSKE